MAKKTRTKKVSDNNKATVAKEKGKVTAKKPKSNIVTLSSSIISDESFIESYSDMCGYTDLSDRSSFIEIDIHETGRHILDKGVVKSDDDVGKYMTSVLYDLPVDYDKYSSVFNILKQMVMDHMFDHSYLHLHSNTKSLNTPVGFEVMSSDNPEFKEPHTYQMIKDNADIISAISRNNRFMHDFSLISRSPVNFINRLLNTDIDFINRRKQMQKLLSISADNIITYICDIRNEFDRLDAKGRYYIKKFYKGEMKIDQLYATIKPVVVKYDNSNILDIIVNAACWYLVTNVFSGDCMVMSYIRLLVTCDQITQNQYEAIMNYLRESYRVVTADNVNWYNEFSSKTLYEILNENTRFKSDIYDAEHRFTSGKMSGYDIQRFVGTRTFFEAGDVAMNIVYDLSQKDYDTCELVDNDGFKLPKCTTILDFISGEININGFYNDIMNFSFTNGVVYAHRMLDDIKKYLICNLFEGDGLMHLHTICDCINEYRIKEMSDNLYKDKDEPKSLIKYIVPVSVFSADDTLRVNTFVFERDVNAKSYDEARMLALVDLDNYFKDGMQFDAGIARLAD